MPLLSHTSPINWRAPLNRGLLRWWLCLPQRHGGNVWRELTRKSNMTIGGGAVATGARGRPGGRGCYEFNGTSGYGQTASIDLSAVSTLTVCMWFYQNAYDNLNDMLLESSATSASNTGSIMLLPNQTGGAFFLRVRTSAGENSYTFTRPSAAVWHHLAVCFDRGGSSQQVTAAYIDGVSQSLSAVGTPATSGTGGFGNYQWNFAARDGGASLQNQCKLDDVCIFNRVLSASQVMQRYSASRVGYPNELRRVLNAPLSFEQGDAPATSARYYLRKRRVA